MKINNTVLTKANLKEMVVDWQKELDQAIIDNKTGYIGSSQDRLAKLRERMNTLISGINGI